MRVAKLPMSRALAALMTLFFLLVAWALVLGPSSSVGAIIKVTRCNRCCENETVIEYEYEAEPTDSPTVAPTAATESPTVPTQRPTKAPRSLPPIDQIGCRDECYRRHDALPKRVRSKPLKVCGGATDFWNCSCSASRRRGKNKLYFCVPSWIDPTTGRRVLTTVKKKNKNKTDDNKEPVFVLADVVVTQHTKSNSKLKPKPKARPKDG